MLRKTDVLAIVIVTIISHEAVANSAHHLRHPRNQFILRKCMATAELNRRNIGDRVQNSTLKKIGTNHNVSPGVDKRATMISTQQQTPSILKSQNLYEVPMDRGFVSDAVKIQPNIEKLPSDHAKNTPLTTVNIKAVRNMSPAFRRKSLLPELIDSPFASPTSGSQNIIRIKPAA